MCQPIHPLAGAALPWRQRDKKSSRATAHAAICHKEYLEKVREAGRNGSTMVTVKQVNKCVEKMSRCKELTVWPLLLLVLSGIGYHSVTPEFVAPGVSYEMTFGCSSVAELTVACTVLCVCVYVFACVYALCVVDTRVHGEGCLSVWLS
ncbi:hypothetical protein C0Q70_11950 [Pomacea canaliculata]|uniref:Uncharacterized protein n=1 Tax=Pomacea canaliculata TaxID=400727 RepID=A0A2T7P7F0_POMCA|nr:hypothetical protein C0Q70_11950 [Pomacea canaliculata]